MKKSRHNPKLGLALGGGSARGVAHIGVLQAFQDHNIPIDYIAGTSAGAIVGALFAFGVPLADIREKAKRLTWYSLSGFPHSKLGLTSNQPLEAMISKSIGKVDLQDAKIPIAIVATDVERGKNVVLTKGSAGFAIRASSCIPGLFAPAEMGDIKLVDGGLAENVPLSVFDTMDVDVKIGVNVVHWHSDRKVANILDVMSNAMDILAAQQEGDMVHRADIIIQPDLAAFSPSDFSKADALVEAGYKAATAMMPEIKALLGKKPRKRHKKNRFWDRVKQWLLE